MKTIHKTSETNCRIRRSSSQTSIGSHGSTTRCITNHGMKRSASNESMRANKDHVKSTSFMKRCQSAEALGHIKDHTVDLLKQNTPGMIFDIVKDGVQHLQALDPGSVSGETIIHTIQGELGTVVGNHVAQSSVLSAVAHLTKHPPF